MAFGPDLLFGDHVALHSTLSEALSIGESLGQDEFPKVEFVDGLENPSESFPNIIRWLVTHGYSDEDIAKAVGGNHHGGAQGSLERVRKRIQIKGVNLNYNDTETDLPAIVTLHGAPGHLIHRIFQTHADVGTRRQFPDISTVTHLKVIRGLHQMEVAIYPEASFALAQTSSSVMANCVHKPSGLGRMP